MKSGIIIINKEKDKTSRDVVNLVCHKFNTKKVGHAGTLDPLATGVLVIAINEGTKLIEYLAGDRKEYIAEVVIGLETDTLDVTGNVLRKIETKILSWEEIDTVLQSFLGEYEQEVPKYSAVHVDGKRLYEYARKNENVKLPTRTVTIESISLLSVSNFYPQKFEFKVKVSKGTYIRSLIRDIGNKLKVPCCMSELQRTTQGYFNIEDAKMISNLTLDDVIPLGNALPQMPKKVIYDQEIIKKIKNGAKLPKTIEKDTFFLDEDNNLLAIYAPYENVMKPKKVFNEN